MLLLLFIKLIKWTKVTHGGINTPYRQTRPSPLSNTSFHILPLLLLKFYSPLLITFALLLIHNLYSHLICKTSETKKMALVGEESKLELSLGLPGGGGGGGAKEAAADQHGGATAAATAGKGKRGFEETRHHVDLKLKLSSKDSQIHASDKANNKDNDNDAVIKPPAK